MNLTFERASKSDLPFVMATERMQGYDAFVGRWDEARHLAAIADDHCAYFLAKECVIASHPVGANGSRECAPDDRRRAAAAEAIEARLGLVTPIDPVR